MNLILLWRRNLRESLVNPVLRSPPGGTSLGGAIATMIQALANLPDVAREAHVLASQMKDVKDHWRPIPDYEEGPEARLFVAGDLPGPNDVDSMTIELMGSVSV